MKKVSKKNKLMITLGAGVFVLAMVANLQYAMNGYGVNNDNLKAGLLANANASGSGYTMDVSYLGTSDYESNSRLTTWLSGQDYIAACFLIGSDGAASGVQNLDEPSWNFTSAQVRCTWDPDGGTCDQSLQFDAWLREL